MMTDDELGFDVAIIGIGVKDAAHMTIEAISILKSCRVGFMVAPDQRTADSFRQRLGNYTNTEIPRILSLSESYCRDRLRCDN
jgi:precorrin-2 methylase